MIDKRVFEEEILILMDWFNRDFEEPTLNRLHERLSQHLNTQEFRQAALKVFDTARFFPTVDDFVTAIKGDAEVLALSEWDLCVKAASRADREMVLGLSPQGQSALHLVGGLNALGMATEEKLVWIKKEFVGVWKATKADTKALPQSRTPEVEVPEALRSLSQKFSINSNGKPQ